jgi:hypothetical protein
MDSEHDRQKAQRQRREASTLEAGIRRSGGRSFRVNVFDLSPRGCKIEFIERPAVGERVWVKFDGLEAVEGMVRWVAGHVGGVEFQRPLHDAVFKRLAG